MGKPGFPIPLPVEVPAAPTSGWEMGKPGFPIPLPVGVPAAPTSSWEMGKPGFGRVWEGCALPGVIMGKPGFPNPLPVGVASSLDREDLGGHSPPKNSYFHAGVVRRSRMDG